MYSRQWAGLSDAPCHPSAKIGRLLQGVHGSCARTEQKQQAVRCEERCFQKTQYNAEGPPEQAVLLMKVVGVVRLELTASSSQTCVGTFSRHSAALFGPFRRSGNSSLTLLCPACFKQNFLLLGWVWDWILCIKRSAVRGERRWRAKPP